MLLPHGSRMSSSQNDKCFIFLDFFTNWFLVFYFIFDRLPPLKRWRRCWLMGPRCQPPRTKTCDILIILQTINSVFRSELLQRDKLNLCFYVNKLICWRRNPERLWHWTQQDNQRCGRHSGDCKRWCRRAKTHIGSVWKNRCFSSSCSKHIPFQSIFHRHRQGVP